MVVASRSRHHRIGFSRAWQAEHPQGSVCSSFLLHQLSLVHLRRESTLDKMSYIARRGLSTLIPPKVASPNAIGAAQDAARMERVVTFYAGLPRGPAAAVKPTGLIGRYQARYFNGKNASGVPLIHAIGGILILGYSMEYYFHLRHHKNHPH
ncbi:hypothetical protein N7455_011813 [Penicillium solitum]|uniref:uncharacterized protein n=1 Tax=Penicillium solitum TaxID=60172 RepID=UPI0032C3EA10|nr:hypothetical protein N7536_002930 [Penicillium majusculum]KAJ5847856.1 hypothetical protein N7455_011813 [Penicillium solitum]